jgi:ASC-1-like (ASCH) protein
MHHVAIMKKSWGLTEKILTGQKTVESRWYKTKHAPWGRIQKGDTVYFKNSGEMVSVRAEVKKVIAYADLTSAKVKNILHQYGREDGIEKKDMLAFYRLFKDKKYCLLIFLEHIKKVKPFDIDKTDFGSMSAWLMVENIETIKINMLK